MAPVIKYSDKLIERLLEGIYNGTINERELPVSLYKAIAENLKQALYEGFGGTLSDFAGKDFELLNELRENVYMFSAAKTFQEVKEIGAMMFDENGERVSMKEFTEAGRNVYDTWNEHYGRTEYSTAVGQATMANKWQNIQDNKDLLPTLVFDTKGNPCEECAPFEGFAADVDDPIWNWLTPLLHFNCECTVRQEEKDYKVSSDEHYETIKGMKDDIPETFQMNPGKDGYIFSPDHPYFQVEAKDQEFAESNFGLPIPDAEQEIQDVIRLAKESGAEVEAIGEEYAKKFGGTVTPMNYKKADSIKRKLETDLDGDVLKLKDAARNTVVVDCSKLDEVLAALKKDNRFTPEFGGRVKEQSGPGYYGYKGIIANMKTDNGTVAEMQVNSPGMIYAKVSKNSALKVMSEKQYNEIAEKTGLPGGLGHRFYEEIRVIDPQTASKAQLLRREELVKESETYYKQFYMF